MPSMPGAPAFWRTFFNARSRLSRAKTWSSFAWVWVDAESAEAPTSDSPRTSTNGGCRFSGACPEFFFIAQHPSSFGPSVRSPPTIPSADFSSGIQPPFPEAQLCFQNPLEISQGKIRCLPCVNAGFTKCIPFADGELCGHVPTRPGCITPHIRFLFIAPQFRIRLPPHPVSRRRTCLSPCLRLCDYLALGLSPRKQRIMPGTHIGLTRKPAWPVCRC